MKPIALIGQPFAAFSKLGGIDVSEPDVNDADRVAFYATTGCDSGIFVGDGTSTIEIARTGELGIGAAHLDTRLSINNQGLVGFSIGGVPGLTGVYIGNGMQIVHDRFSRNPCTINDVGIMAYATRSDVPSWKPGRILTSDGRKIAVNHNETEFRNTFPSINDSGEVAFQSRDISTNKLGIFVGSGVPLK